MRIERVAEEIKREVSSMLMQDLRDPRIGFVTITRVEISADLRNANIYYSILGNEKQQLETGTALKAATGFVRKLIGQRLNLRFNPEINFKFDKSIAYSVEIEKLINEINDEQE
jgi:ribosome-binding factor A